MSIFGSLSDNQYSELKKIYQSASIGDRYLNEYQRLKLKQEQQDVLMATYKNLLNQNLTQAAWGTNLGSQIKIPKIKTEKEDKNLEGLKNLLEDV